MIDQLQAIREEISDRYVIEREVGRGGMATVYLARDLRHERPVALKILRPELALAVGAERFSREIKYAAGLQHSHILPVYDSGTAGGQHYYVMPFVEGESVGQRIQRLGRLPLDEALEIATQVASALHYAHDRGVVHRDIKPGNIMFSDGNAVVADFGVAFLLGEAEGDRLTHTGVAIGTPAYMSPEQASGEGSVDGRSDIYSLGCVLFEMLAGESPYRGATVRATIAQRFSDEVPLVTRLREGLPSGVVDCVRKAMSKMPSDRFQTGAEFRKGLEGAVSAGSGEHPAGPVAGKRPGIPMFLTVVAAAIMAMVVWQRAGSPTVIPGADVIAVVPFNANGAGVAPLGEGMVDLLSANLDGVGGIRTVDPRAVMDRWRRAGENGPADAEGSLRIGRELQAGAVLQGSVVEAGPSVRITAELVAISGERLARVQVDGPSDSILGLVDNVSARLLREIWRSQDEMPKLRVSSITTESLDAVRAYLRGEYHYNRSSWDSAAAYFERATQIDSTFALAFLRLTHTYGWLDGHGSPRALARLEAGKRFRERLPPREQDLMEARDLLERGRPQSVVLLRQYVRSYPSDAEGWYELADAEFHAQTMLGITDGEILQSFDKAIALVPSMSATLIHPLELSLATGDRSRFEGYLSLLAATGDSIGAENFQLIGTALWGDDPMAGDAMERVVRSQSQQLDLVFQAYFNTGVGSPSRILRAMDQVLESAPGEELAALNVLKARFLSALGRLAESRVIIDSVFAYRSPLVTVASVYPVIAGFADVPFGDPGVAVLSATAPGNGVVAYLRAFYASRMSNALGARAEIAGARSEIDDDGSGPVDGLLTAAMGRVVLLEGDTLTGVAMLRDGMDAVGFSRALSIFLGPARFELGLTLSRNPDTQYEGISVLRYGLRDELEFRAISGLAAARALERAGDVDGAVDEYNRFVRIWAEADVELQPIVGEARHALARLVHEPVT